MRGDNLKIFVSRNTDESIGTFHLCPRVDPSVGFSALKKIERRKRAFVERETFFVSARLLHLPHLLPFLFRSASFVLYVIF